MNFLDELHVGDQCKVTDLRRGETVEGVIVELHPGEPRDVVVKTTGGRTFGVNHGFVSLFGEETP